MATEFRPLNETELHAIRRAIEKGEIGAIEGPNHSLADLYADDLPVGPEDIGCQPPNLTCCRLNLLRLA